MKMLTKADKALIVLLILLGITINYFLSKTIANINVATAMVVVKINGKVYEQMKLNVDGTYNISQNGEINILTIKNGVVKMDDANCPNKICVNEPAISHSNERITCLPHKLVVEIINGTESDIDSVVS